MNQKKANVLGVIPARMGSTRLAQKAVLDIGGKTLVQRVWERAREAQTVTRLIVATDSDEIRRIVAAFGGEVMMTDEKIPSGTDRVAAVVDRLGDTSWDAVINIQGDMPFITAEAIDRAVNFLVGHRTQFSMSTVAVPITTPEEFNSPDRVKLVLDHQSRALYFSRSAIPFSRDGQHFGSSSSPIYGYRHIGLYVYSVEALKKFTAAAPSQLELIERLEQLRALELGISIGVCVVEAKLFQGFVEIDTAEDLERARALLSSK